MTEQPRCRLCGRTDDSSRMGSQSANVKWCGGCSRYLCAYDHFNHICKPPAHHQTGSHDEHDQDYSPSY